jgi:two-component system nitrogen regulation sensor histidine kinase NtrY
MYTRNLHSKIILLIFLLVVTVAACSYLFYKQEFLYAIVLLLPAGIEIALLIYFFNRTNRKILYFFDSIRNEDFSLVFPEDVREGTLKELHRSLNRVNRIFAKSRADSETNEQFYRSLISHAKTGLMAINSEGRILEINPALENMFASFSLNEVSDFGKIDPRIPGMVEGLEPGKPEILKVVVNNELQQLLFNKALFQVVSSQVSIVSVENIKNELNHKELDSWIRLIRILNHEIVNAVTPISTLSMTLHDLFRKDGVLKTSGINEEIVEDTADALHSIDEHARGLIDFVNACRKLTRLPEPSFEEIVLHDFIQGEIVSLKGYTDENPIDIDLQNIPEELSVLADPALLQRVFSNILINAIQALDNCSQKKITISATTNYINKIIVKISDNGAGIPEEELDQVFVPFFSTKEDGSGIGLSLCRQIMHLHNGEISINSRLGEGTEVSLVF